MGYRSTAEKLDEGVSPQHYARAGLGANPNRQSIEKLADRWGTIDLPDLPSLNSQFLLVISKLFDIRVE